MDHGNSAEALELIARTALREGRIEAAGEAFYQQGNALLTLDRSGDAATAYERALTLSPRHVEAYNNLGHIQTTLGKHAQAERSYRQALAIRPDVALIHNNLGGALLALDRTVDAERCFRDALVRDPRYAEAHNNLGVALHSLGRSAEAVAAFSEALALNPGLAQGHYHLGLTLVTLGLPEEAERSFRLAIAHKGDYAEALYDLGNLSAAFGRPEESERCYRQALALRPDFPEALGQWVHQCQWLCAWPDAGKGAVAMRAHVALGKPGRLMPFCFLALAEGSATEQLACARQFAEQAFGKLFSRPPLHQMPRLQSAAPLRVGYLSGDFREHAISYLLAEVIEHHDRKRVEAFGYSSGPDDRSPMRLRMQTAFHAFQDIRAMNSEQAARQIAADGIDILVDLAGFTSSGRLETVALRPAPVQVNWLGHPGTLGHRRLADYVIGDPVVTPLEHSAFYSERLAQLPHCYLPNDRRPVGPRPERALAGLAQAAFVFCCFCQPYKITPAMFDLWCSLLREVSGSQLWLMRSNATAQDSLRREALSRGVASERLVFGSPLPLAEHLGRLQLADLALDTFPYTSHATASDALWSGVPLVTMLGDTYVSRVAASVLHAAGLPDLVTRDAGSYFHLARTLAKQPALLQSVRARVAASRTASPLFDSERFARDLERLYERMWANHRAGIEEHLAA